MKVKFKTVAATMAYGRVNAGDIVDVKDADGKAFIKNGLAIAAKKEKKENG